MVENLAPVHYLPNVGDALPFEVELVIMFFKLSLSVSGPRAFGYARWRKDWAKPLVSLCVHLSET